MTRRSSSSTAIPPPQVGMIPPNHVPGRLAALQTADMAELRAQWRSLFGTEPPAYSRRFMAARLGYRVQELAYGGLRPERWPAWKPSLRPSTARSGPCAVSPPSNARCRARALSANGRGSTTPSPCCAMVTNGRDAPTSRCRPLHAASPARAGTGHGSSAYGGRAHETAA